MQYDRRVLWYSDHKLAISLEVLPQLYKSAMHAYKHAGRGYKEMINSPNATNGANLVHLYEKEILKHTQVLLILSCDFTTAWNSRKLLLSRKHNLSLCMDELQLSKLILSYSPKSEYAWSHRRWVIKMIEEQFQNLQGIVEKESDLVKEIAEKSKMNYRAWNHRCWLLQYMTKEQVLNELSKSRKWAELHVADNCCFHYRRQLMRRMLEDNLLEQDGEIFFGYKADFYSLWKDELKWNEWLIERYIGREALWIHRRFLSQCWVDHFKPDLDLFLAKELQLLHTCQSISVDGFEDTQAQARHAASYILWILKVSKIQSKSREVGDLKAMLIETCPEKTILWESLLG